MDAVLTVAVWCGVVQVRKRKAASRPAAGGRKKGTKTTKVNKQ